MLDIAIEPLHHALKSLDVVAELRTVGAGVEQVGEAVLECRELLAELIVHLAGDAAALVLLREHEPREELRARALGLSLAALREVEVRPNNPHDGTARPSPNRKAARQYVDVMAVLVAQPE